MRKGKDPKRRLAAANSLTRAQRTTLAQSAIYEGSPHHKLHPGDYGFEPAVNPRPGKSVCDGVRHILRAEASELLRVGIMKGMVSTWKSGDLPKYIWAVDAQGEAYEAKLIPDGRNCYKGYRLENEDNMRDTVLKEWKLR